MSNSITKIEFPVAAKLRAGNYKLWRFNVERHLKNHNVWEFVIENKKPVKNEQETDAEFVTREAAFTSKNVVAELIISNSVEESEVDHIMTCESAYEMWKTLQRVHEKRDPTSKLVASQAFHDYRYETGMEMSKHIANVKNLARRCKDLDDELSETSIMAKLLQGLPTKYRSVTTIWRNKSETDQKLSELCAMLEHEEAAQDADDLAATKMEALHIKQDGGKKKSQQKRTPKSTSRKSKEPIRCFNCEGLGHIAAKCPSSKKENDSKQKSTENTGSAMILEANAVVSIGDEWLADSGASAHITGRREWFSQFEPVDTKFSLANGKQVSIEGRGEVEVECLVQGRWQPVTLKKVSYIPGFKKNLFSIGAAGELGVNCQIYKTSMSFKRNGKVVAEAKKADNNLFIMRMKVRSQKLPEANVVADLQTWHERLGHVGVYTIKEMSKRGMLKGLDVPEKVRLQCEACELAKSRRRTFRTNTKKAKYYPGEMIHTDVSGPFPTASYSGKRWFILFKDEATGFRMVFFMRHKNEALAAFKKFVDLVENKWERRVKILRSDNGLEYENSEFLSYLESKGIEHEPTAPYTPEQNGRAERDNQTIDNSARAMLVAKGLDERLWAEAVRTAVYVLNRTPTKQCPGTTPYEQWSGKKISVSHIRTFGSIAYMNVPKIKRTKWAPKARKMILIGYEGESTNYRLMEPNNPKRVVVSANVKFHEETRCEVEPEDGWKLQLSQEENEERTMDTAVEQNLINEDEDVINEDEDVVNEERDMASGHRQDIVSSNNRYQLRNRKDLRKPDRFEINLVEFEEPLTYAEAMTSSNAKDWKEAIDTELQALEKAKTWIVSTLPKGKRAISSKWIFKIKRDETGNIERFKARLVARGYSQREGIDYTETFAPVVRYESVRTLLAIAALKNLEIGQFDIKTAFLNRELEEEIYMRLPEGATKEDTVVKLKKSLYGLKQSPRQWNKRFHEFLTKFKFKASNADRCVYQGIISGKLVLLALYVDDGLVLAKNQAIIQIVLETLKSEFEVTIGSGAQFLGLEIRRDSDTGTITISQEQYIKRVLKKFEMTEAKPVSTPVETNQYLKNLLESQVDTSMKNVPYQQAVGSLMFAACVSRPDIMFAVSNVSKFLHNPSMEHWKAVKRILRYLKGTSSQGITYTINGNSKLIGYCDADYANDKETRKSITGLTMILAGGPVVWASRRQSVVAQSTAEAEYIAAAEATKEILWLRQLLRSIGLEQISTTVLNIDNQSAIKLIRNPELHRSTKHIDVRYHLIRDHAEKKDINVEYVSTKEQLADIFTKGLPKETFVQLRNKLSIG